jgi:hypothetical protein
MVMGCSALERIDHLMSPESSLQFTKSFDFNQIILEMFAKRKPHNRKRATISRIEL